MIKSFPDQLSTLRKRRQQSIAQMSTLLGMAVSNLASALNGKRDLRASTVEALASALDAKWVLVPNEYALEVDRLIEGKGTGPDSQAKTSMTLLLEKNRHEP